MLLVEVVVGIFTRVHGVVLQLLHLGPDDLVRYPVIVVAELLEGSLSVAADASVVFVLLYRQGGWKFH